MKPVGLAIRDKSLIRRLERVRKSRGHSTCQDTIRELVGERLFEIENHGDPAAPGPGTAALQNDPGAVGHLG